MIRGARALCRGAPLLLLLLLPRAPSLAAPPPARTGGFENGYHAYISDLAYVARTYFFLSDHPLQWDPSTLRVYRDDRILSFPGYEIPGTASLDPTSPLDTLGANPACRGYFTQLVPGVDYDILTPYPLTADQREIPVIRLKSPESLESVLGVYFTESVGTATVAHGDVTYSGDAPAFGKYPGQILIQMVKPEADLLARGADGRFDPSGAWYPALSYELRNIYDLGVRNVPMNRFRLAVRRFDPSMAADPDTLYGQTYLEHLGLDRHGGPDSPDPSKPDGQVDEEVFDSETGLLSFPDLHPFDPDTTVSSECPAGRGGFLCLDDYARNPLRERPYWDPAVANPQVYYYRNPNGPIDSRYYLEVSISALPPKAVVLHQNRPNPFNPSTRIPFGVREAGTLVTVRVFDLGGRLVRTLLHGTVSEGEHETYWDGSNEERRPMPSGVYFARIEGGGTSDSRTLVLLR